MSRCAPVLEEHQGTIWWWLGGVGGWEGGNAGIFFLKKTKEHADTEFSFRYSGAKNLGGQKKCPSLWRMDPKC